MSKPPVEYKLSETQRAQSVVCRRRYRSKFPDRIKAQKKIWKQTIGGRYNTYKESARYRGLLFEISKEEFANILNQSCYYCGTHESIGVDRVDNTRGYISNNVAPCCTMCNKMKLNHSLESFLEQITKIYKHLN
jgi:Zn-finger domain-containing protein